MPIHLVPLVVGGTIAVLGTSYAFKKVSLDPLEARILWETAAHYDQFVYDPHLAPLVDAFLATHTHDSRRLNDPVSVRTTSRDGNPGHSHHSTGILRRRGNRHQHQQADDGEEREGLLLADLEDRRESIPQAVNQTPRLVDPLPVPTHKRPSAIRSSSDRPQSQDAEIRSVIFNHPASPPAPSAPSSAIGMMGTGGIMLMPEIQPPAHRTSPHAYGPSTTFSFLSLSQASSPEVPTTMLDSMTSVLQGEATDDMVSLPDTTSGYESTEPFSMVSSPRYGERSLHSQQGPTEVDSGLGLSSVGGVRDVGMSYLSPGRNSRSVISLSESEGASDWEALSEARAGPT